MDVGGYFCEKNITNENLICDIGYEYDDLTKKCNKCKDGQIKEGFGNLNKFRKCPLYTELDKENKFCKTSNFIYYQEDNRLFNFKKYSSELSNLCRLNNKLCIDSLYGPIQDEERNFYYISYNTPAHFVSNDFTFLLDNKINIYPPGFIFVLEPEKTQYGNKIKNLKQLANKINNILIINEKEDRGFIVQYTGNEICPINNTRTISSYLYFKC